MRKRISWLACLLAVTWLAACGLRPSPSRPNVILISLDSLGTSHMSLYGYGRKTTPNLDAWATDRAVYFRDYYTAAYLTPISEASVHTGRYPVSLGMMNFESTPPDAPMLAEILKREGYRTAAFGTSPEFLIYPAIHDRFQRGFERYEMSRRRLLPWEPVFQWMKGGEHPFFLWVAMGNMHWPYGSCAQRHFSDAGYRGLMRGVRLSNSTLLHDPSAEANEPVVPGPLLQHVYQGTFYPFRFQEDWRDLPDLGHYPKTPQKLTGTDIQYVVDRYDEGVATGDAWLAQLLREVDKPELSERTIVIIQAEHGEDLGEHGRFAHYDLVDTTVHVPLIVRTPNLRRRGAVDGLVSSVDILPTLLDLLSIRERPKTNGRSFAASLHGGSTARDAVYLTRTPLWERMYASPLRPPFLEIDNRQPQYDTAIRTTRWKLVHRRAREMERRFSWFDYLRQKPATLARKFQLFDEQNNPSEEYDSAADQQVTVAALSARLLDWEREMSREAAPLHSVPATLPYF